MLTTDRNGGSALCLLALFVMWESRTLPLRVMPYPTRASRVPNQFPVS